RDDAADGALGGGHRLDEGDGAVDGDEDGVGVAAAAGVGDAEGDGVDAVGDVLADGLGLGELEDAVAVGVPGVGDDGASGLQGAGVDVAHEEAVDVGGAALVDAGDGHGV